MTLSSLSPNRGLVAHQCQHSALYVYLQHPSNIHECIHEDETLHQQCQLHPEYQFAAKMRHSIFNKRYCLIPLKKSGRFDVSTALGANQCPPVQCRHGTTTSSPTSDHLYTASLAAAQADKHFSSCTCAMQMIARYLMPVCTPAISTNLNEQVYGQSC